MPPPSVRRIGPTLLRGWPLPIPQGGGKDERGRIIVIAGSPNMPGAAVLAATAALRAGAGKLQIATCASIAPLVAISMIESFVSGFEQTSSGALSPACADALQTLIEKNDALVIGPGMIDEQACGELLAVLVQKLTIPAIVDATALACLRTSPELLHRLNGRVVLTPHGGEMANMLGVDRETVERDPLRYAREAANRFGAVVALKDASTYIATPSGEVYCNQTGHIGLATCGSGDTLAGIIGGLLARGAPPLHAACWGVYLHAQAGSQLARRIGVGFLAREIPAEIPVLLRDL